MNATPLLGAASALGVHRAALDLAGEWVREGRAVALGEVGRAHFPVSNDIATLLETAFRHAFEVARDVGCPIVVHSADLDEAGFRELAERAREVGMPPERVVKHFARARVRREECGGVAPSYLARRELVRVVKNDPGPGSSKRTSWTTPLDPVPCSTSRRSPVGHVRSRKRFRMGPTGFRSRSLSRSRRSMDFDPKYLPGVLRDAS